MASLSLAVFGPSKNQVTHRIGNLTTTAEGV
jgi:hypothetical protein